MLLAGAVALVGLLHEGAGFVDGALGVVVGLDGLTVLVYGALALAGYVEDFAQLGHFLSEPVWTYSTGMQGRLNFALSLAIDFDCYLIDEIIAVGDKRFQKKSFDELFGKRKGNAMIIVSHNFEVIQEFCSGVLVLKDGRARLFQDKRKAFDIYATL